MTEARPRVLAVITARGGSKGVPRKNVREVAGKPLLAWTLEAALSAHCIDEVVVSSDDDEILALAAARRARALRRPPELATDTANQEDAVVHAMRDAEERGGRADIVVLMAPTNPLRTAALVDEVVSWHVAHPHARATLTVVECEHHPLRANRLPPDCAMANFMPNDIKWKNRQELPTYYRISGSVCVADWDHFLAERSFLTAATYAFPTEAAAGIDVDTELDLEIAALHLTRREPAAR